jgi:TrpR-related protein YerC/YecD
MKSYPTNEDRELIKAFRFLETEGEIVGFLRDLCTPAEIEEFSRRFRIAKLLWTTELPYLEIAQRVGTSTTTVTRVAHWLYKESYKGYRTALKRMYGANKRNV